VPPPSRVMVIEDDDGVAHVLGARLRAAGYDARCFSSAAQALGAHLADPHDVIVLDVNMPGMDGFEFLERLASENAASAPVIVLSAGHPEVVSRHAIELGAAAALAKPFRPAELLGAIRDALSPQPDCPSTP